MGAEETSSSVLSLACHQSSIDYENSFIAHNANQVDVGACKPLVIFHRE